MYATQINQADISGGAARAAYRLHLGIRGLGHVSRMVVLSKASNDPDVHLALPLDQSPVAGAASPYQLKEFVQRRYVKPRRTAISNTLFSLGYPGLDLSGFPAVRDADVLNLHWVPGMLSADSIKRVIALDKPVVWTLHDQWAFTGGCHYSCGCIGYETDCRGCPQLEDDELQIPLVFLKDKLERIEARKITVVTPSTWLSSLARKSRLFRNSRVETITNSLETDLFRPLAKAEAKARLGIPSDSTTLLFGADSGGEKRKGFETLQRATQLICEDSQLRARIHDGSLNLMVFGDPPAQLASFSGKMYPQGYVRSDETLRIIYSAADITLLPSLEDNYPNLMIESLSCGTPVIGSAVGGIQDLLGSSRMGLTFAPEDAHALKDAIKQLTLNPVLRETMGRAGRAEMAASHGLTTQATRYTELYADLLHQAKRPYEKAATRQVCGMQTSSPVMLKTPVLAELPEGMWPNFGQCCKYFARATHFRVLERLKTIKPWIKERLRKQMRRARRVRGR